MPRHPTPAQSAASRANALHSTGPATPEGKARAAQNARSFGLRSAQLALLPDEDHAAFGQLEASIHAHFVPATPLEASLCARMAAALWRTERAEALEQKFRVGLPAGVKAGHPLTNLHILNACQQDRPQALPTLLRYLSEADRAFGRALRHLNQLRSGHGLAPAAAPIRTNEPEQGAAAEPMAVPICTNEPERGDRAGTDRPGPPPASVAQAPGTNEPEQAAAAAPASTNEPERRMDVAEDDANEAEADPSEIEPGPPALADHLASGPTVDPVGVAASPGTNEPEQAAAAVPASTNEPESKAERALRELAHLRAVVAKRWPPQAHALAESFLLTRGLTGEGRPNWIDDLPEGVLDAA